MSNQVLFHFRINDSNEDFTCEFSDKTAFIHIYEQKLIHLCDDLINFKILKEPLSDAKIPPIYRFDIKNEEEIKQRYDTPLYEIVQHNPTNIIYIKLRPPKFSFKMRSHSMTCDFLIKRGTTVNNIKPQIIDNFKLDKYDFYLMINGSKLNDESSFDEYDQVEGQFFIIIPKNPTYQFKFNESRSKSFQFNPSTTIREVKSLILPQVSSKMIEISLNNKILSDNSKLEDIKSNGKIFTIKLKPIELKPIELQIQLPAILKSKFVTISVDENDTIKDIKTKLIKKALSMPSCKEFKYIDFSLFYMNKELDDKTLYKDIKYTN